MVRHRVRIRFSKQGDLRWLGHRDLVRAWERIFRRARVSLRMSEGFRPRPRMSFPSALAVGIAGLDEVVELELTESCEHERLAAQIAPHCPSGLEIRAVEGVGDEARAAQVACLSYESHVPIERRAAAADGIAALLARETWLVERDDGRAATDLRPLVASISLDGGQLRMELRATRQTNVRPRQVLAALGLDDLEEQGVFLTRTRVELES